MKKTKNISVFERIIEGISITKLNPLNFKSIIYDNNFNVIIVLNESKKGIFKKNIKSYYFNWNKYNKEEDLTNIIKKLLLIIYEELNNFSNIIISNKSKDCWITYILVILLMSIFNFELNFIIDYLNVKGIKYPKNNKIVENLLTKINLNIEKSEYILYLKKLIINTFNNTSIKEIVSSENVVKKKETKIKFLEKSKISKKKLNKNFYFK